MQTLESIDLLIEQVECKFGDIEFQFIVSERKGDPVLQIYFEAPCNVTGKMEDQWCRKWQLQWAMTDTEIVRTAYKAAEAAFIHELQESFKFKGVDLFNSHVDVHRMVAWRMNAYLTDVHVHGATAYDEFYDFDERDKANMDVRESA